MRIHKIKKKRTCSKDLFLSCVRKLNFTNTLSMELIRNTINQINLIFN